MPAQKRPRTDKACQSCITSKVRCQDLLPAGCLRCRRRQDECSLAGTIEEAVAPASLTALSDKIDALSNRLGSHVVSAQTDGYSTHASSSYTQPPLAESLPIFISVPTQTRNRPSQVGLNELGGGTMVIDLLGRFSATAVEGDYPSIVHEGQMGREQLDAAFQLFKHRITTILPLYPYTLASTKCPDHRFLQLCALTFTPTLAPSALQSLIDRSVIHAMCGAIGKDVVQGLLILSLSPLTPPSTGVAHCCLSPVSLIGLAYTMGLSLGLEERSRATFGQRASWAENWNSIHVEAFLMWETVKARYRMLHLQLSQASFISMPACMINDIPSTPSAPMSATVDYLQQEYQFASFAKPVLDILSPAEAGLMCPDSQTARRLIEVCGVMCHSFEDWRQGKEHADRLLDIESVTIPFMLTVRIMTLFQTLPSPVSADWRTEGVLQLVGPLTEMGHQLISRINTRDISEIVLFPAHIHTIIAIAVCAAQRMLHQANGPVPSKITVQLVVEAERRLGLCGMELPVVMPGWNKDEAEASWAELWQSFLDVTAMSPASGVGIV